MSTKHKLLGTAVLALILWLLCNGSGKFRSSILKTLAYVVIVVCVIVFLICLVGAEAYGLGAVVAVAIAAWMFGWLNWSNDGSSPIPNAGYSSLPNNSDGTTNGSFAPGTTTTFVGPGTNND